jgi:serine/threonine protein kinase
MPRNDKDSADVKTDIFALGSTIYHIFTGHRPFPQLHIINDEAEFLRRFREGQFPVLEVEVGGNIIRKCWEGREVVDDLVIHIMTLATMDEAVQEVITMRCSQNRADTQGAIRCGGGGFGVGGIAPRVEPG